MIAPGQNEVPQCAKCGHQVALFSTWRDEYKCITVFQAECHGKTERVEIPDFRLIGASQISLGKAFAQPELQPVAGLLRG